MIRLNLNEQQSEKLAAAILPLMTEALGALTAAVSGIRSQIEHRNDVAVATRDLTMSTAINAAKAVLAQTEADRIKAERQAARVRLGQDD